MGEQIVSLHHTQRTGSGMYRVQTYGNFHAFRQIDRIPVCHINAKTFFQCRTAVREMIFDHQILRFLCIDKRCNVCLLSGDHRLHLFHAHRFQVCSDLLTRPWCDLIDHRPWKCNDTLVTHIIRKILIHKTIFLPFFRHSQYRLTQFRTVSGTVVHGNQGDWVFSCFISLIQHRCQNRHRSGGSVRAVVDICFHKRKPAAVCFLQGIAFFCDREGNKLQRFCCKDFFQAVPLRRIGGLCLYRFRQCSQDFVFSGSVTVQDHTQTQIVIRFIDLIYHIVIKGLHTGNASIQDTFFQKSVCNPTDENTENVSNSKMYPSRCFFCFLRYCFHIVPRQFDTCFFPCLTIFDSIQC